MTDLATALRNVERVGSENDSPEGSRYLQLSDSLANQISEEIESLTVEVSGAFFAGWEFGVCAVSGSKLPFPQDAEKAYEEWRASQTRQSTK